MVSDDTDIAAVILAEGTRSVLDDDNIPNENQSESCRSCRTPMQGLYCLNCGQKNDDYRRSLFSLFIEMMGNITAIDARIWRTWLSLLTRPGRVAREFADGARTKWTSPVRAYLAMSLMLFGYIAVTGTQIAAVDLDIKRKAAATGELQNLKPSDFIINPSLLMFETSKNLEARHVDDMEERNYLLRYPGRLRVTYANGEMQFIEDGYVEPDETPKTVDAELENLAKTEDDDERVFILNGEEVEPDEVSGRFVNAMRLVVQRPEMFNGTFAKYLPRVMFLMMPATMLLGAIFIRGRGNAFLYDHLVHAAYIHAVFFFLVLIGLILGQYTPIPTAALFGLLTLYMLLYLPMSLGGMFARGMIKTIWTSYAVGFIYFISMIVIIVALTVMGINNIMTQADLMPVAIGP